VLKHHKVALGVEFYATAASLIVQQEAEDLGHWDTLISIGAKVLPAGCDPCIDIDVGLLGEGDTESAR